jgi:hypothetical protein
VYTGPFELVLSPASLLNVGLPMLTPGGRSPPSESAERPGPWLPGVPSVFVSHSSLSGPVFFEQSTGSGTGS